LEAKEEGKTKDIGVSNFGVKHLKEIEDEGLPMPGETSYLQFHYYSDDHFQTNSAAVNQIELHPWCQQKPIVDYCNKNNVVVQAYCPLVRAERNDDPALVKIAQAVNKTPSQVLVRWSLQRGFVPLPKSDTPSRISKSRIPSSNILIPSSILNGTFFRF
jgi:diketogulonate reductase-like aldo/keto reductase